MLKNNLFRSRDTSFDVSVMRGPTVERSASSSTPNFALAKQGLRVCKLDVQALLVHAGAANGMLAAVNLATTVIMAIQKTEEGVLEASEV